MNRIEQYPRALRLIQSIINDLNLNLKGIRVLTEAASGPFVLTAIIAAVAGSEQVIAVTQDSPYGRASQVKEYTERWARALEVQDRIEISSRPPIEFAHGVDLVTNLGFVRPINKEFIAKLAKKSAISLMWEPWEYREEDLDLQACREYKIPILGTDENHPRLEIFRYIGMIGLKLLFEANIEIFNSSILVVSSGIFGNELQIALENNGATVTLVNPSHDNFPTIISTRFLSAVDAIVVAEHHYRFAVIGEKTGIPTNLIKEFELPLVHICGNVNYEELDSCKIVKFPNRKVPPGYMTVTTGDLGIRPIVDLHGAGLKVGESLVRAMRQFNDYQQAIDYALVNSPSLSFE